MSKDDGVQMKMGNLDERTHSWESGSLMIDCWLPLIILVFSFTKVYVILVHLWRSQSLNFFTDLNVCFHTFGDLWVGWHAFNSLILLKSENSFVISAAGAVLFKLLLQLEHRNTGTLVAPGSFLMCLSLLGELVTGLWLHYARTLPLIKTASSF